MSDLNFLNETKEVDINKDKLKELSKLSLDLKTLREESSVEAKDEILLELHKLEKIYLTKISVATIEEVLKTYKAEEQLISQVLIPSILNECNLSEIKLTSGERIIIKDKVKSSIADKRIETAFAEMVNYECEKYDYKTAYENINGLFKEKIILEKLTDEEKEIALEILVNNEIPYENKKEIHWQTLNSYVREKLDRGEVIPESINVFRYQETEIKK
jgi:hypothetical protein